MNLEGNLRKLQVAPDTPVSYRLPLGDEGIELNAHIGSSIRLEYTGEIHCVHCGRKTSKSFNQGYCYPCMQTLAECDTCLIKPELCHYHEGTCREPAWGEEHCLQDHFVYLANTSGLKVGITRQTNVPTRWMDQGATQALPIYRTRDRLTAGQVEVILKQHVADKTAWQRMLKGDADPIDLAHERDRLHGEIEKEISDLNNLHAEPMVEFLARDQLLVFSYPVSVHPVKVNSLNFDKTTQISGTLLGIKGQYLILDSGVLNVRKFSGYNVRLHLMD